MKKREKLLLSLSALFLVTFLLVLFNLSHFSAIDRSINSLFSTNQNNSLVSISKATAWLFQPEIVIVYALIISLMLFIRKYKKESVILAASMLITGALIYITKEIIQRARPENALILESSSSFPSGHALASLVFFGFFIYFALKNLKNNPLKIALSVLFVVSIVFIGISRLILNVHWLSDVLGGWLLGLAILLASVSIKKYILK